MKAALLKADIRRRRERRDPARTSCSCDTSWVMSLVSIYLLMRLTRLRSRDHQLFCFNME